MDAVQKRSRRRLRWVIFLTVSVALAVLFWPLAYRTYTDPNQLSYSFSHDDVSLVYQADGGIRVRVDDREGIVEKGQLDKSDLYKEAWERVASRGIPVTRTSWRPFRFLKWWVLCVVVAYYVIVRWGDVGPKYLVGGEVK